MQLPNTIRFVLNHPLARRNRLGAFKRLLRWQITARLTPSAVVHPFVGETTLLAKKGMTGVTGNIYAGLHEFEDMAFVLHFLRPEDRFADVGANIGSYTVLAGGVVGSSVTAIEPLPDTFRLLKKNVALNELEAKTRLHNVGVGADAGTLRFTRSLDTMNHVATDDDDDTVAVQVLRLDDLLREAPALAKIDVEGFEIPVLRGAARTLANPTLRALIVEINDCSTRYGHGPDEVHEELVRHGFSAHSYDPFRRALASLAGPNDGNTIYVRDLDFVIDRLRSGPSVTVLGQEF